MPIRPPRLRSILRRLFVGLAFVLAAILPPAAWLVGNVVVHVRAQSGAPAPRALPATPAPAFDPALRTAVVVTGSEGAEISDFLIPYEALATTGAFNLYVVAPERQVIPLASAAFRDGGLDLVPHYALDEYDRDIGRTPDVIVIPYLPAFADGGERALVPWLRKQAERGALIVSICAGAEVLAATGLLDGTRATTHPNFFARLEARHPGVRWVRDVRFVETDRTISSGAIASGMDATLAAIRRLLGPAAADDVARRLGYRYARFLDAPAYATGFDMKAILGAASLPGRDHLGVLVHDGIGELALGSVFDTYPATLSNVLVSIGEHAGIVTSRHGLWLLPRHALAAAPALDRLLVPGAPSAATSRRASAWGLASGREVAFVHAGATAFAYDAPLADIARRESRAAARAVAINLNYPSEHLVLDGPTLPASAIALPLALSALGVALLVALRATLRRRRRLRAT